MLKQVVVNDLSDTVTEIVGTTAGGKSCYAFGLALKALARGKSVLLVTDDEEDAHCLRDGLVGAVASRLWIGSVRVYAIERVLDTLYRRQRAGFSLPDILILDCAQPQDQETFIPTSTLAKLGKLCRVYSIRSSRRHELAPTPTPTRGRPLRETNKG